MLLKILTHFGKLLCSLFSIVFVCLHTYDTQAQTMTIVSSPWNVTIPPITEAGSNYTGTYESATDQSSLTVRVPLLLGFGKVSVSYQPNPIWNDNLQLAVKRTNNGVTLCVLCGISGGTNYQTLTPTATELFRIGAVLDLADYNNINIQYQLSGVSVTVPVANYQSRIVYTVSAL